MREIKFRAWDKQYELMVSWEKLQEYKIKTIADGVKNGYWMQFTGIKDKNGKEIYEGDILKVTDETDASWEETQTVEWNGDDGYRAFDFDNWGGEANGLSEVAQGNDFQMEIIGNIHSNPELLK